ncbi:unnamed protein product, partial [Polarella glacialis]
VRIWPRESTEMVIQAIHNILASLGLQDDQWHYREILDYVRQIPADREVVVTGHSLGGGIALVVGALTGRLAVAVQPPGIYHSLAKHQTQHGSAQSAHALHKRSVSLVFEGDWVQNFDGHGGLVQTMMCDQQERSLAVGCHLIEGAICHLLRHCGDQAQRFATCRHEYQPTSTAVALARSLWGLLRASFLESSYPAYLKGNLESVLYAGLAVSLAAVVRFAANLTKIVASKKAEVGEREKISAKWTEKEDELLDEGVALFKARCVKEAEQQKTEATISFEVLTREIEDFPKRVLTDSTYFVDSWGEGLSSGEPWFYATRGLNASWSPGAPILFAEVLQAMLPKFVDRVKDLGFTSTSHEAGTWKVTVNWGLTDESDKKKRRKD